MNEIEKYNYWINHIDELDSDIAEDLQNMRWDARMIEDGFSRELKFGTSGLRGIMGAGTNRMNKPVVRKVSQGISEFLHKNYDDPAVVIAYDTRENSFEYAVSAAEVFCANGIPVFLFNRTVPVPMLSYVIPRLGASLGVMMTASHNSREYNGYKVYGAHGHQILEPIPEMILDECSRIDEFKDVKSMKIEEALEFSLCAYVEEELIDRFMEDAYRSVKGNYYARIAYTPLNGAGLEFLMRGFDMLGMEYELVENQLIQDGKFETCTYPNPEKFSAFSEAIKTADEKGIDYIIATDPDCDRLGIALRTEEGFRVLTGNEIGILMFNYICSVSKVPRKSVIFKSIVSTPVIDAIAKAHKIEVKDTLIGFKYIGELIYNLDKPGNFLFGMEESNGYLIGPYTWDKDGVGAAMMAARMLGYYNNPIDALDRIYSKYGFVENRIYEYVDSSFEGRKNLEFIMDSFRKMESSYSITDFLADDTGMPEADILKLEDESSIIYIRPSGTEPKLKIYIFAKGSKREDAVKLADELKEWAEKIVLDFIERKDNE